MKMIFRALPMTLGTGVLVTLFVSNATAGCGLPTDWNHPMVMAQTAQELRLTTPDANAPQALQRGGGSASIVGMWKYQLISKGNTAHNPSIPDGAILDFGYQHWHSDGTEFIESGGGPPATGNFCLGVWGQTGYLTYEINHFPIGFDPTSGDLINYYNLREQDTLSPSGNSYTGTFTMDTFDTNGNQVDHVTGTVVATRITVDSTLPGAIPTN